MILRQRHRRLSQGEQEAKHRIVSISSVSLTNCSETHHHLMYLSFSLAFIEFILSQTVIFFSGFLGASEPFVDRGSFILSSATSAVVFQKQATKGPLLPLPSTSVHLHCELSDRSHNFLQSSRRSFFLYLFIHSKTSLIPTSPPLKAPRSCKLLLSVRTDRDFYQRHSN